MLLLCIFMFPVCLFNYMSMFDTVNHPCIGYNEIPRVVSLSTGLGSHSVLLVEMSLDYTAQSDN